MMRRRWMNLGASHDHADALLSTMVCCYIVKLEQPFTCMACMSCALNTRHFCMSIATSKWGATMASLLHLHRLCLTPSNAGSLGLLFRRTFAQDGLDPTEKAAKKVQDGAKKVSQKWDDAKGATKSTTKSVADKAKHQVEKELNTAHDMAKDIPKKTKEAAKGIKEVGKEAAKSVKREAEKVVEKVGIKEKKKSRD